MLRRNGSRNGRDGLLPKTGWADQFFYIIRPLEETQVSIHSKISKNLLTQLTLSTMKEAGRKRRFRLFSTLNQKKILWEEFGKNWLEQPSLVQFSHWLFQLMNILLSLSEKNYSNAKLKADKIWHFQTRATLVSH